MAYNDPGNISMLSSTDDSASSCQRNVVTVDGTSYSQQKSVECRENRDGDSKCSCDAIGGMQDVNYVYKTIPSYIMHISPTDEEFGAQINSMYTPSLPVDSDRYIDFIAAGGGTTPEQLYRKIYFPQLFRIDMSTDEDISFEKASEKVKEYLDAASTEINSIIAASKPASLSGNEAELFALLST